MPAKLDQCVATLKKKWASDPDNKPTRFKNGDKWVPIKSKQDEESAAFAICRASVSASDAMQGQIEEAVGVILEEGHGPVLKGVAFVNRPYLKNMRPLAVVSDDSKEFIKAQLVRYGIYRHPNGPDGKLPFTRSFWQQVCSNFRKNVYGQKVLADQAHSTNAPSLGEVVDLTDTGDGVDATILPTKRGLDAVKNREYHYASIDLDFFYLGNQVSVAASDEDEPLEMVDWTEELFFKLAEQQAQQQAKEGTMAGPVRALPEAAVTLEEFNTLKAELDQLGIAAKERETKLRAELAEERAVFLEDLRKQKVELFLSELSQPDAEGRMLSKNVLELARKIMLCEPVGDGDAIQLAEDAGTAATRAYFLGAVEELVRAVPRIVPGNSQIEAQEQRPDTGNAQLSEARQQARQAYILAKQEAGVTLTEEVLKEIDGRLDRQFGIGKEG